MALPSRDVPLTELVAQVARHWDLLAAEASALTLIEPGTRDFDNGLDSLAQSVEGLRAQTADLVRLVEALSPSGVVPGPRAAPHCVACP